MKLSIIVVNYNVKYFLQQLLLSIEHSIVDFDFEVIVIDNASSDDSQNYIPNSFPKINYVFNAENVGFAKANNQGIALASGELILLLNPDTLVQEDTLQKSVDYLDRNQNCGALGVRMIDGSGSYLPESKRGFPTPMVAFFKSFGLADLFPLSPLFNRYYLGHLPEHQINDVDVLTGAFMMVRYNILSEIGPLDENFFMYGEDIDLSFRIRNAGHRVVYYPETSIIHFKGESTRKDSIAYYKSFYGAMILFAEKHYSGSKARLLRVVLRAAIYFKAIFNLLANFLRRYGLLLFEAISIAFVLLKFSTLWAVFYFHDPTYYASSAMTINITVYAGIWIAALFFAGTYDDRFNWRRILQGWFIGWLVVAILYAFFSSDLRPSRFIVFSAGPIVLFLLSIIRSIAHKFEKGKWSFFEVSSKRFAIVGDGDEAPQVLKLLMANHPPMQFIGRIAPRGESSDDNIGHVNELDQIVHFHLIEELIFCSKNISASEIMQWMTKLGPDYHYKIAPDQALTIIGSRSKNRQGEWFTFDVNFQINSKTSRRNKRLLDIAIALVFFVLLPLIILLVKQKRSFLNNVFRVAVGSKTWVSYTSSNMEETFPPLKPGILSTLYDEGLKKNSDQIRNADFFYARDYSIWKDLSLIFRKRSQLGDSNL